jgi:putative copper resistance protein D
MHGGHEAISMNMSPNSLDDPETQAKLLADKRESEFNHHFAGLLVLLAGMFILAETDLTPRWHYLRFAWPATFLISGLFLLIWSDTELWPFGPQSWLSTIATNREVFQHKTYAVILLALGIIELQRTRGSLRAAWASWVFPVVAIGGSVLLLFHMHQGGMHGSHHSELMTRIQSEHLSYSVAGISIGLTKALSEAPSTWQDFFRRLWPALMMVLGALLMMYLE